MTATLGVITGDGSLRALTADLFARYNVHPRGVIHVGAHQGEEVPIYRAAGIGWIVLVEPAGTDALLRLEDDGDVIVYDVAVGDISAGEMQTWHRAADTVGSGLLPAAGGPAGQVPVTSLRNLQDAQAQKAPNVLVVDTQGTELEVLRTGDLDRLDLVVVEADDIGRDASPYAAVVAHMTGHGWRLVEQWRHGHHPYSDLVFVREVHHG